MAIKESLLTVVNSIGDSDFVRAVTSAGASRKLSVSNLAKHIVETYTGSTIAGSAQSVKSAVDAVKTLANNALDRVSSAYLPAGTNIDTSSIETGVYVYERVASGRNVQGTFPVSDTYGTIFHINGSSTNIAMQIIRSNGSAATTNTVYQRFKVSGTWGEWIMIPTRAEVDALPQKTSFSIRTVTWNYTAAGNSSAYTNLYTLINGDLPSGGTCLGIVGYSTNNSNVLPVSVQYANNNYSAQVRNISSSSITTNMNVRYLCLV